MKLSTKCKHLKSDLKLCCNGKVRSYICSCGIELYEGMDKTLRTYEDHKNYQLKLTINGY